YSHFRVMDQHSESDEGHGHCKPGDGDEPAREAQILSANVKPVGKPATEQIRPRSGKYWNRSRDSGFNQSKTAHFGEIGWQPAQKDPQDVAVAEVHRTEAP